MPKCNQYQPCSNMISQCPGLVDSVHYVMHLLTASPYTLTSGASPTDIELVLSPKLHVSFSAFLLKLS